MNRRNGKDITWYNFNVICVATKTTIFTPGFMYAVRDGWITADNGSRHERFKTRIHLNSHLAADFEYAPWQPIWQTSQINKGGDSMKCAQDVIVTDDNYDEEMEKLADANGFGYNQSEWLEELDDGWFKQENKNGYEGWFRNESMAETLVAFEFKNGWIAFHQYG